MTEKPKNYVVYAGQEIRAVATLKDEVLIEVLLPDIGLMPGYTLAFRIRPSDARSLATLLQQAADQIEKKAGPTSH